MFFNPFHATGFFRYPLKTSENQVFWCFQRHRKRPVAWNGLIWFYFSFLSNCFCLFLVFHYSSTIVVKQKATLRKGRLLFWHVLYTSIKCITFCKSFKYKRKFWLSQKISLNLSLILVSTKQLSGLLTVFQ